MGKNIHCGRLVVYANGKVEKVNIHDGGGIRYCDWKRVGMTFEEIHESLRVLFKLGKIYSNSIPSSFSCHGLFFL